MNEQYVPMSQLTVNDLILHRGHKIVSVAYGESEDPANYSLECEDCSEVLADFDCTVREEA